ncbi:aldose epimerase family protein [Mesobacillus maritimus]|uniref:Aldose 1-epimerase n=1 Tax=Mesobacillus maritimus TaxID=1643336 RepID=A0ABS7KA88_9BACI|nr:aldose epimerase family protein [Mesobacillus maritimus]MBY0099167.1 galactose mutarotase [Mesobacillus maritimus]
MRVYQETFGELNGQTVTAYTMVNDHGMEVTSLDYGCIISKLIVPDQHGTKENVVLGFDTVEEYVKHSPYFGAVIGRVAGRISGAEFELDGQVYKLAKNDGEHHLHGGNVGFDKVIWNTEVVEEDHSVSLVFTYLSMDGEEGYPGNVKLKVSYTLTNDNELQLAYEGVSDQKTLLNVTNHTYFNLSGDLKRDILDHELMLKSTQFAELDSELIPTGELLSVNGTSFDFTAGRKIKDGVEAQHPQNLLAGKGYDHPFVLDENQQKEIVLIDEESGRTLVVETDQPGVVLYTGTQLGEDFEIRGVKSRKYLGLCLETQGMPDAIHQPSFPSVIVEKDEVYTATTKWRFRV